MHFDPIFYLVMTLAITVLGLSKGGFAGIGMVSTPMVALIVDPITAVGLILPIMLVQDAVAVFLYRDDFDAGILLRMIPGGVLGVAIAYLAASHVPEWGVQILLGVLSIVFSVWQGVVHLSGVPSVASALRHDRLLALAAGAGGGFASAIAHAGSPPFQIYAIQKRLRKEVYVGTSVMFFAALNLMKLPSYAALGLLRLENLKISALFIPLAVLASWAGAWLVRFVNPRSFDGIIIAILFGIGVLLIGQGYSSI